MVKNVIIVVLALALGFGYYHFVYTKKPTPTTVPTLTVSTSTTPSDTVCAQVITPARNPDTGDIREFPTPCDVPKGWEVIQNDIPDLELNLE
jgi:hypothetical protein